MESITPFLCLSNGFFLAALTTLQWPRHWATTPGGQFLHLSVFLALLGNESEVCWLICYALSWSKNACSRVKEMDRLRCRLLGFITDSVSVKIWLFCVKWMLVCPLWSHQMVSVTFFFACHLTPSTSGFSHWFFLVWKWLKKVFKMTQEKWGEWTFGEVNGWNKN